MGVSNIGNTLPSDIVEALRDFTHPDEGFFQEADYEFYIPEGMIPKLPDACPCGDMVEDAGEQEGAAGCAVAHVAPRARPSGDIDSDSDEE